MTRTEAYSPREHLLTSSAALSAIQSSLRDADTQEALGIARDLTCAYPKNIFVLGLFKQIEKIADAERDHLPHIGSLHDCLPLLVERALETTTSIAPHQQKSPSETKGVDLQRRKALEQVKSQYLSLADGFMRKGNFEHALAEVRRALMLDPADEAAKGYATKLNELVELQANDTSTGGKGKPASLDSNPAITFDRPPSLDELVTMTKTDFDSIVARGVRRHEKPIFVDPTPTQLHFKREGQPAGAPKRKSMNSFLIGSAFLIVAAIVTSYFIATTKEPDVRPVQQQHVAAAVAKPATQLSGAVAMQKDSIHMPTSDSQSDSLHINNLNQQ